jgi:hypothetical protein
VSVSCEVVVEKESLISVATLAVVSASNLMASFAKMPLQTPSAVILARVKSDEKTWSKRRPRWSRR